MPRARCSCALMRSLSGQGMPRAMTMQGPRVSVSASEMISEGWELVFTISLLENPASPKSKALTFDVIEEALNYGAFKGLGQWRNGQNGRFKWKRIA